MTLPSDENPLIAVLGYRSLEIDETDRSLWLSHMIGSAPPRAREKRLRNGRRWLRQVGAEASREGRQVIVYASETSLDGCPFATTIPFPISPDDARRIAADLIAAADAVDAPREPE